MAYTSLLTAAALCLAPQGSIVSLSKGSPDLRDPKLDGWGTEVFAQDVVGALKNWKQELAHGSIGADHFGHTDLYMPSPAAWTSPRSTPSFHSRRLGTRSVQDLSLIHI